MILDANYTPQQLETALLKSADECAKLGRLYAEAKAKYEKIEDLKKIQFSIYLEKSQASSISAKEKDVLCSKEWEAYIKTLITARTNYLYAQMEYETACRNFDTCRSLLSSKNTERRTCI